MVGAFVSQGAYGGVYRCHCPSHPEVGEQAVKVVRVPAGKQRELTQLRREIDIGRELQRHPNVVTWLDIVSCFCCPRSLQPPLLFLLPPPPPPPPPLLPATSAFGSWNCFLC